MASSQRTLGAVYEEFQPKLEKMETPEAQILQIHLPGFTRDQVKIRYLSPTKSLSISGEKPEGDKWSRLSETIPVPENCEMNRLRAQFDRGILTITMPRKFITPAVMKEEPKTSEEEISQDPPPGADYDEFQPIVDKIDTPDAYLLKVYLPGFSKDQVKVKHVSSSRVVSISGERSIEGGKRQSRFEQTFPILNDLNEEKLEAKFDEGILTVTIPKKVTSLAPKEEAAMAEPKLQRAEDVIPPKPTGVEGLKRSSSLLNLEEIDQKASIGTVYEEFHPKSELTENIESYHLQIHLPGFTKEQVMIKYISSSRVVNISGERPIEEGNRWVRVDQVYSVPENCDAERVRGKFDHGILSITMPKKFIPQLVAPKDELKTTLEKFPSPLDKYATPSLEKARDMKSIASHTSFPQKGKVGLVPKPTRLTLHDQQAAPRNASVEGKRIEEIVDVIGKGIQEVAGSASSAVTNIGDGTLNGEEKHLLAVLIAAVGAYVTYRLTGPGKPYNY